MDARDSLWLNAQPGLYRLCRVAFATDIVGQLVADMLMQYFIERRRRISRRAGYSPLILSGVRLFLIQIFELVDGFAEVRKHLRCQRSALSLPENVTCLRVGGVLIWRASFG